MIPPSTSCHKVPSSVSPNCTVYSIYTAVRDVYTYYLLVLNLVLYDRFAAMVQDAPTGSYAYHQNHLLDFDAAWKN
jgi:hypothetical protein